MVSDKSHKSLDILHCSAPDRIAMLINDGLLEPAQSLWPTPAMIAATSKKADRKYQVPTKDFEMFYTLCHPILWRSPLVKSAQCSDFTK